MIQFITNHPIWTDVILYLIIGFILGVQYYLRETYNDLIKKPSCYTKIEIINEYIGLAFAHILFWFVFIIADIWDLNTAINNRYNKSNKDEVDVDDKD